MSEPGGRITARLGTAALVAAVVGAALHLVTELDASTLAIGAMVVAYASLEAVVGRMRGWPAIDRRSTTRVRWVVLDVVVVAAVLGGTGGLASPYLLYAAVVVVASGAATGRGLGALAGLAMSLTAVTAFIVTESQTVQAQPALVAGSALVLVALGALGGSEARAQGEDSSAHLGYIKDLLEELLEVTQHEPTSLDEREVARTVAAQADALTGGEVLVLVERDGQYVAAAASRRTTPPGIVLDALDVEEGDPAALRSLTAQLAEIGFEGAVVSMLPSGGGMLLAASPVPEVVLTYGARALANAEIFRRIRDLAADQERRRMAADLHDGLAQVLAHLRFELDLAASGLVDTAQLPEELARLSRVAERALAEARSTITGLRASVVSEGLAGTLRGYVSDLSGLTGPGIGFDCKDEPALAPEHEQQAFRIVQEAVSNALRHADADRITIRLRREADEVVVEVEDNGRGFRPGLARTTGLGHGLGMATMSNRAEKMGARLVVTSDQGQGTRVELRCPLPGHTGSVDADVQGGHR